MAIVGFNFLKISAEKKAAITGPIKIAYNMNLKEVSEGDMFMGQTKQKGLKFVFEFSTKYEPNVGELNFVGEILAVDKEERVKQIVGDWNAKKRLEPTVIEPIMNTIWSKCMVQAILAGKEVNLPPPFPIPKINVKPKEAKDGKEEKGAKETAPAAKKAAK